MHINHRVYAKSCHYKHKSHFNNIKYSFKSLPSNPETFGLTLANKPEVTIAVTKIKYFAQSQKEASDRKKK